MPDGDTVWQTAKRLRCGTAIVREEIGPQGEERPTWWCPHCQPSPD